MGEKMASQHFDPLTKLRVQILALEHIDIKDGITSSRHGP